MSAQAAFQDLIYNTLMASPVLTEHVGKRIYDNPPTHPGYPYISFGPSYAIGAGVLCIDGQSVTFQIDIWTNDGGEKRNCRVIVDAVRDVLRTADLALPGPYSMGPIRISLVRVMDDPDPGIAHGVVQIEVHLEA